MIGILRIFLITFVLSVLTGCTLSISLSEPWPVQIESQSSADGATPAPTPSAQVQPTSPVTRYLALQGVEPGSATTVTTRYLLPVEAMPAPLISGFGSFVPPGPIKAALAHADPTDFPILTANTAGPWVLFLPEGSDPSIQSWAQVVITSSTYADVGIAYDELRRPVDQVIMISTQPADQKSDIQDQIVAWSEAHTTNLWVDLALVEETQADGKPKLVLYRFALIEEFPAPGDEQNAHCRQVCNPDTLTGALICWWNGC